MYQYSDEISFHGSGTIIAITAWLSSPADISYFHPATEACTG